MHLLYLKAIYGYFILIISFTSLLLAYDVTFTCDAQHKLSNLKLPVSELQKHTQFTKKVNDLYFKKYPNRSRSVCSPKNKSLPNYIKTNPDPDCTLGYFQDSPYMYVTGRRLDNPNLSSNPVQCNDLDQFIEDALLSNQDPYSALAVSLMENGTNINHLYLDPIGVVEGLGCQTQASSKKDSNLSSFETYYKVNYSENIQNKSLSQNIKDALSLKSKEFNIDIKNKKSYICSKHTGVSFETTQLKNQCCLEIDFFPEYKGKVNIKSDGWNLTPQETAQLALIEEPKQLAAKILTFSSLNNKYLNSPLSSEYQNKSAEDKAAFRAQKYNGYAQFSGSGENMPIWRSAVNYTEDPAYGYQAMDFILNSLMVNPVLQAKIKKAEVKFNKKPMSFLCLDRPAGNFKLQSDYYFIKHKQSGRMDSVYNKWITNKAISFSSLEGREKRVLAKEFQVLCTYENPQKVLAKVSGFSDFKKNCGQPEKQFQIYMSAILPLRNTVQKANQMETGLTWQLMSDARINELATRLVDEW